MGRVVPPKDSRWFLLTTIFRFLLYTASRALFNHRTAGQANIPTAGGVLLVANHLSYIDVILLQLACPRFIHYVAKKELFDVPFLGFFLRLLDVVPISQRDPRSAFRHAVAKLREGEVVCLFPEGRISRTGSLLKLMRGFEIVASQSKCPVVPAIVDGVWGSVFSASGNRFFWKKPLPFRRPFRVLFGPPLGLGDGLIPRTREALHDLQTEAFQMRPALREHAGRRALRALASSPWRNQIADYPPSGNGLSAGALLAIAIALSRRWKKTIPAKRVPTFLPSGPDAIVANLALLLADRIPVTLDTAGAPSTVGRHEVAIASGDALPALEKTASVERAIDIAGEIASIGPVIRIAWTALVWLLPGPLLSAILRLPPAGDDHTAAVVTTGGSAGQPPQAALTHSDLHAAAARFSEINLFHGNETLVVTAPLHTASGFSAGFLYPIFSHRRIAFPSPDANPAGARNATGRLPASAALGDPLPGIRFVLAELHSPRRAFPAELQAIPSFAFWTPPGAAGPVSANLPDPKATAKGEHQPGCRPGSAGRLLPGVSARILSEDGTTTLPLFDPGILCLRGPGITAPDPDDKPGSPPGPHRDWLVTGQTARFDPDGFLFVSPPPQ